MAVLEVLRVVVAEPDFAVIVLPGKGFEWEVDCGQRRGQHERRAAFWAAEDEELGRGHVEADFFGFAAVVYTGEDLYVFGAEEGLEAVQGFRDGVGTGVGDDACRHA